MVKRSGFTLVELMIIIIVLGILTVLVSYGFSSAQKYQRDTQRAAAVNAIMNELEKYYDENGEYPYVLDLNPNQDANKLHNYDIVRTLMPDLSDSTLNTAGNHFYAYTCPPPTSHCPAPAGFFDELPKMFYYFSTRTAGQADGSYFQSTGVGCRLTIETDSKPGAIIVWREEATGKWNFVRSLRGDVTIAPYGTGNPQPPTKCEFSSPEIK